MCACTIQILLSKTPVRRHDASRLIVLIQGMFLCVFIPLSNLVWTYLVALQSLSAQLTFFTLVTACHSLEFVCQ
jgi:hypothetical protein